MSQRRTISFSSITSMLVASTVTLSSMGCFSKTEVVNTDRYYLLGPKTESVPGPTKRDATTRALDTKGVLAFHVDRARECTVTSTPRYQKVHIEGRVGKNIVGGLITGIGVTVVGAGLIAGSVAIDGDFGTSSGSQTNLNGKGYLLTAGIITALIGLVILPIEIKNAAAVGTEVTPGDVQAGKAPFSAVRAPAGYDPNKPEINALLPRMEQPQYNVLALGAKPAAELRGANDFWSRPFVAPAPAEESLRSARMFDKAVAASESHAEPALLGFADSGGVSDAMKACVEKYTPTCQTKCTNDKDCLITCLRKPCVENLDKESEPGANDPRDEYTEVITRTELCERSGDAGVNIALTVKDIDGVPKTIEIGKTNGAGDVKKDMLAGLEGAYSGWPDIKQVVVQEAQVVLVEDPTVVLGKLDLAKYPGLKYEEHIQSTKKAREQWALTEQTRKDKEAKDRQAQLEAAAKAQDDLLHADERKAEAAKKAQACLAQHQSKCSADCQGN